MLFTFLLIQNQRISTRILAPQNDIQSDRHGDQNCVAADDTLPHPWVVFADFL